MYKDVIYCCAICSRVIKPPVNFKGLDAHRECYNCESQDWLVLSNLEYLEMKYKEKQCL